MNETPTPLEERFLRALAAVTNEDQARRVGREWRTRCPAHEDEHPSLDFREDAGRILVTCRAGCQTSDVLRLVAWNSTDSRDGSESPKPWTRPVAREFVYRDVAGAYLRTKVRFGDVVAPKCMLRDDGALGRMRWRRGGPSLPLYRAPELLAAPLEETIWMPEGERDVETLVSLGLVATCTPHGAGKWRDEYGEPLRGRDVVLLQDADKTGMKDVMLRACKLASIARSVRIVPPLGSAKGFDLTDWVGEGHTREELFELVKTAPDWKPEGPITEPTNGFRLESMESLLDAPEEAVRWTVDGMLPAGGTSLFVAKPKVGKSTLSRQLSLAVSRGEPFLGRETARGPVVILAFEEKRGEARAHLRAMGAVCTDDVHLHFGSAPENAMRELRALVERLKPALVVVDPLFRLAGVKDTNDYAQVLAALAPLTDLARETGAHMAAVHHAGKGGREGADAILGSTAIFGSVDTAVMLKRGGEYRTIATVQRYGEDLPESVLSFDRDARTSGLAGTRAEAEESRVKDAILAAVAGKQPMSEEELLADVEARTGPKRKALRELVRDGRVSRTGSGKRSDAFHYGPTDTAGDQGEGPDEVSPSGPESDSRFSFPHISGNKGTRNEREALGPLVEPAVSRSHDSAGSEMSGTTIKEAGERESEPDSGPIGRRKTAL
jgi:hypothetical protein